MPYSFIFYMNLCRLFKCMTSSAIEAGFSTEPPSIKFTGNFYKLIMTSWLECPVTGHSSSAYAAEIKGKKNLGDFCSSRGITLPLL